MEKQRSFSFKPTRFLLFSFTISSSVIFLTFFSIWVIKAAPSFRQESDIAQEPFSFQALSGTVSNYSSTEAINSILKNTHLKISEDTNSSGFEDGSQSKENRPKLAAVQLQTRNAVVANLTVYFRAKLRGGIRGMNDSVPIGAHFGKTENTSRNYKDPVAEGLQTKEIEMASERQNASPASSEKTKGGSTTDWLEGKNTRMCDLTKGRWVLDESRPLYTNASCPFIDEGFNCEANGRLDRNYMKWRWQPRDCDLPRFNATNLLEHIRGKRLVFVGDSINRNQWESMLCLLLTAVKDPTKVYESHRRRITKGKGNYSFKFLDYKCTVEYYVTHFLVRESKARVGKKRVQTLRIDTIDRGSSRWKGSDILVFNTANWWNHHKTRAGMNYYQEGDQVHPHLHSSTAFRTSLQTWASWVDEHLVPGKTQVFFRSSAPSHFRGGQWNAGGHCKEASMPLNETLRIIDDYPEEKNAIAEEVIRQMKTPVTLLNVTRLSEYRIDGHPSVYGRRSGGSGLSSSSIQDCSHWCLPGVPDTWNELLYFHLLLQQRN